MIVDKIYEYLAAPEKIHDDSLKYEVEKLAGAAFRRQFMNSDESSSVGKLRLSSAGRCARQLAYAYHGFEKKGKESDARSKLIFWTGDLVEMTIVALAKISGCHIVSTGFNQIRVSLEVGNSIVEGHPDGLMIKNGVLYLVEVKSMSSYSFEKFEKGIIDDSYLAQVNTYMDALQVDKCIFVGLNKENGVLHEQILERNSAIVTESKVNLRAVMDSTPEKLPPQSFKPDKKGFLPWNCLYCAYWGLCWPQAEKVLVRNSYKLKAVKNGN